MKKLILVYSIVVQATLLSAQVVLPDSSFRFSGFVNSIDDSTGISSVHILNLTKGTGTVSSVDGSFTLRVRNHDTLEFSCIGFEGRYLMISRIMLRKDVMIFLQKDTIMMDELLVHPLGPRRFFKYRFMEYEPVESVKSELGLEEYDITKDPAYIPPCGVFLPGPVQLLYDAFNKKARLSRRLRQNRKKYFQNLQPVKGDSLVWPEIP